MTKMHFLIQILDDKRSDDEYYHVPENLTLCEVRQPQNNGRLDLYYFDRNLWRKVCNTCNQLEAMIYVSNNK